ncbi:efflux RND transporter periplasmic adaptor subunit [Stagnimonas aquatica]|uniref:Efflux RND transporter periplasmic adaptor subunit n=1 Tax=Stagnimonas aquatica TaxID=2689987 RepID=A0A3N0VH83_9GAMM|nr:efflux RND transporter periplasmic adaptor subunit [Stagnimonas aquatica]ROH92065.1 efflux RND transporter periplasmic adaptor subunit [Stagnimonas aquatica]
MAGIPSTAGQDIPLERAPRFRRRGLMIAAAAALLALLVWAALRAGGGQRVAAAESLRLATVSRGEFIADVSAQGRVVAAVSPTLYAPAVGTINLKVNAGDRVEQGQLLAELDSPEIQNQYAQEEANLAGLRASFQRERLEVETRRLQNQQAVDLAKVAEEGAERERKRAQEAYGMGVLPIMEVDRRADELINAQLRHRHAQEEVRLQGKSLDLQLRGRALELERQQLVVDNMRRRAEELRIVAPVNGVIGTLSVLQRAAVAANQALMTVVDLSALEVEIQVPETYADSLGLEMPAEVRLGSQTFPARLTAISPEVANNQVTGRVAFTGGKPPELRQNQRVSVRIVLDQRQDVLRLPRGPFIEAGGGRYVYVVRDGVAVRTPVTLGAISINQVEIVSGVEAGEQVVISGDQAFEGAETVSIRN